MIIEHIMGFITPNKLVLLRGESNNVSELATIISQACQEKKSMVEHQLPYNLQTLVNHLNI